MKQILVQEKYPVFILDIFKNETTYKKASEIIEFFRTRIEKHPVAKYIAEFDHFEHTSSLEDGNIAPEIKDAKIIIFCFGKAIPNAKILAARPRSIAVTEFNDKFEVSFLEPPAISANETMESWVKELRNNLK